MSTGLHPPRKKSLEIGLIVEEGLGTVEVELRVGVGVDGFDVAVELVTGETHPGP